MLFVFSAFACELTVTVDAQLISAWIIECLLNVLGIGV